MHLKENKVNQTVSFCSMRTFLSVFQVGLGGGRGPVGSALDCRVEGRAIDTALGQVSSKSSSH